MSTESFEGKVGNFAGRGSIGLLIGLLVGLSSSPIVSSVVGILAAIVATVFPTDPKQRERSNWGVCAFALAAILGVLGGLYLRTNDKLSPSAADYYQRWHELKYSDDDARTLVAYQVTGLILPPHEGKPLAVHVESGASENPSSKGSSPTLPVAAGSDPGVRWTELRAKFTDADLAACGSIAQAERSGLTQSEVINTMRLQGGHWAEAADFIQRQQTSRQKVLVEGLLTRCE